MTLLHFSPAMASNIQHHYYTTPRIMPHRETDLDCQEYALEDWVITQSFQEILADLKSN